MVEQTEFHRFLSKTLKIIEELSIICLELVVKKSVIELRFDPLRFLKIVEAETGRHYKASKDQ